MEKVFLGVLVVSLCLSSTAVFYLACPNQQWFSKRYLRFYPGLVISFIFSVVAWNILRETMSVLSATFTVLSLEMMCLGLLPFINRYDKPLINRGAGRSSLTRTETYATHNSQWVIKIVGMLVIGLPFAVFTSSMLGWAAPDSVPDNIRSQFIMWMITPLWLTPLSLIFFSRKPVRTFGLFIILTLVAYGLLQLLRNAG